VFVIAFPFEDQGLARRNTIDPILTDLRTQVMNRLRGLPPLPPRDQTGDRPMRPRIRQGREVLIRTPGDLTVRGVIEDVGSAGLFVRCELLAEVGERAWISLVDDAGTITDEVPARVMWTRHLASIGGVGMGLAFEVKDPTTERRAIELVLAALE
jgi:hypothetical protein